MLYKLFTLRFSSFNLHSVNRSNSQANSSRTAFNGIFKRDSSFPVRIIRFRKGSYFFKFAYFNATIACCSNWIAFSLFYRNFSLSALYFLLYFFCIWRRSSTVKSPPSLEDKNFQFSYCCNNLVTGILVSISTKNLEVVKLFQLKNYNINLLVLLPFFRNKF